MKNKAKLLVLSLGLVATALLIAQDGPAPREGGPGGDGPRGPGGQGGPGGPRPQPALILALDANHDGVIDADEIANASAALKKLDKNGDGKLTREEYLGPRPGGPGGPGGPDGQRGPGKDGQGRRPGGPGGPGEENRPQRPPDQ